MVNHGILHQYRVLCDTGSGDIPRDPGNRETNRTHYEHELNTQGTQHTVYNHKEGTWNTGKEQFTQNKGSDHLKGERSFLGPACRGGYPRIFFQRPVPSVRHPRFDTLCHDGIRLLPQN